MRPRWGGWEERKFVSLFLAKLRDLLKIYEIILLKLFFAISKLPSYHSASHNLTEGSVKEFNFHLHSRFAVICRLSLLISSLQVCIRSKDTLIYSEASKLVTKVTKTFFGEWELKMTKWMRRKGVLDTRNSL